MPPNLERWRREQVWIFCCITQPRVAFLERTPSGEFCLTFFFFLRAVSSDRLRWRLYGAWFESRVRQARRFRRWIRWGRKVFLSSNRPAISESKHNVFLLCVWRRITWIIFLCSSEGKRRNSEVRRKLQMNRRRKMRVLKRKRMTMTKMFQSTNWNLTKMM